MTASALPRAFEKAGPGGVFLLHGEDEFRKEAALRAVVDWHLDPATRDFNFDVLRGGEVDVERLASVVATPPMMAEWRVVVLRETEALAGSARARDVLLEAARRPPPGLALVLACTPPEKSRAKFYTDLERACRSAAFPQVSPNDLPAWLIERAQETHGLALEADAAAALAAAVGADLGVLAQELEKLAAVVGDRGRVAVADVESAGIRLPRQNRWAWFDLVAERRFAEALDTLPVLLAQNESGVALVAGLGTHLLRLAAVRHGGAGALDGVLPGNQQWIVRKLSGQARGWTPEALDRSIDELLTVDRLLKASRLGDLALLEGWLLARRVEREAPASAAAGAPGASSAR